MYTGTMLTCEVARRTLREIIQSSGFCCVIVQFCCFSGIICCRFISYGSGPKRFPLQDVLQYALEFIKSKKDPGSDEATEELPEIKVAESTDVEMESPKSQMR